MKGFITRCTLIHPLRLYHSTNFFTVYMFRSIYPTLDPIEACKIRPSNKIQFRSDAYRIGRPAYRSLRSFISIVRCLSCFYTRYAHKHVTNVSTNGLVTEK